MPAVRKARPRNRGMANRGKKPMGKVAEMRVIVGDKKGPDRAQDRAQDRAHEVRAEEVRILEALLFAAATPLDEKTLASRLPAGTDVRSVLQQLQGDYALRGRRKAPGRPVTYGTNETFLSHFGLDALGDLPGLDELKGAGLVDAAVPADFAVPVPSDDPALRDDEEPLGPEDVDLGLAPRVERTEE